MVCIGSPSLIVDRLSLVIITSFPVARALYCQDSARTGITAIATRNATRHPKKGTSAPNLAIEMALAIKVLLEARRGKVEGYY